MTKWHYILVYFASLLFFVALSFLQKTPGYMDAAYYYSIAQQLALGKGATEPFIWNYLANPITIPTPAFTYWMPLASILAYIGMITVHSTSFVAARVLFIPLAALIPVFSIYFNFLYSNNKTLAFSAGLLGLASGYYLPYLTITETFIPYFVLGSVYLIISFQILKNGFYNKEKMSLVFLLGCVAGLTNLTRSDGILWLIGAWIIVCFISLSGEKRAAKRNLLIAISVFGYIIIISPWLIHNLIQFGFPFPPGSNLAIYFTNYNDLFIYPINSINFEHLISSGMINFLQNRLTAVVTNLDSVFLVTGGIVLFPFICAGIWKLRKEKLVQFSLIMFGLDFVLMSFVFPFAGERGGFFHEMTALQCFFWGLTPIGFEYLIGKLATIRNWKSERAFHLFGVTLLSIVVILSLFIFVNKVTGLNNGTTQWNYETYEFIKVDAFLKNSGATPDQRVMVNDSPLYYSTTGRGAIQMISGTIEGVVSAMDQFNVSYLLIDKDHTAVFDSLYNTNEDSGKFKYLFRVDDYVVYTLVN